ncbi:hypothetical protein [Endozoicomonas sp. YOMI1]|uniref:hypothetical protein n=1 Tax=Endozoicomonas sp. YOMI1 TaxID=2828739 RepID=UPI002147C20F|nr:hypothetical protein [Endozoicomonas sp. YOMI1]
MNASRAQSANTPVPGASSQTRELKPPSDAITERRRCQLCAEYIEYPPLMVSRCCGHAYHNECSLATRDVLGCSECQATHVKFYQDTHFAEEVKQYDWSLFESAPEGAVDKRAPVESIIDSTSVETGSLVAIPGPSGLSMTHNQQDIEAERSAGRALSQRGFFNKARLDSQEAVSTRSAQRAIVPSQNLDLNNMTVTFARLCADSSMPEELEDLITQSGYHFLTEMMEVGVVPKWREICGRNGHVCGKQMNIDKPDETNAFFTAMLYHLDQLAPNHPLFVTFVCSRQSEITDLPQQVSPVSQILRHPSGNRVIWLTSVDEPLANHPHGRLIFGVFASGIQLVKYLRFLILTSEPDQVMFVRPTIKGESDAEGLDNINIKEFIQHYPPRDMGVGGQLENDREILLAAAQSLGLQRIPKGGARKVVLLNNLIEDNFRDAQLTKKNVLARLNDLGYYPEQEEIITSSLKPSQMFGLPMSKEELRAENVGLQLRVADVLKEMHEVLATTAYIQIQLATRVSALPDEILVLVCDADRLYLVNMKRKSVPVQCSSSIDDIADFCQVFMSGCHIREAHIMLFMPSQTRKIRAS